MVEAADTNLIPMLRLVARSPGGSAESPIPLSMYGENGFYFELAINENPHDIDFEEHLSRRLRILAADYYVEIHDYGLSKDYSVLSEGNLWSRVDLIDGQFLVPSNLLRDHVYGWNVVAVIDDGGGALFSLNSEPLFFHTSGYNFLVSDGIEAKDRNLIHCNSLRLLYGLQASEGLAVQLLLNGSRDYVNYPIATDSYVCTSVSDLLHRPLLPIPDSGKLQIPELIQLGRLMQDADELKSWITDGNDPLGQLVEMSSRSQVLVNRIDSVQPSLASKTASLRQIAKRLHVEESLSNNQQLAILSEFILLGDNLAGSGSMEFRSDPTAAFLAYVKSTDRRLWLLTNMDTSMYNLLGAERGLLWQEYFRSQRAELVLLRDDLLQGHFKPEELPELLDAAGQRAMQQLPQAPAGMDYTQYGNAALTFDTLASAGIETDQIGLLLESQFAELAAMIWPLTELE